MGESNSAEALERLHSVAIVIEDSDIYGIRRKARAFSLSRHHPKWETASQASPKNPQVQFLESEAEGGG